MNIFHLLFLFCLIVSCDSPLSETSNIQRSTAYTTDEGRALKRWSENTKRDLTYCISDQFGEYKDEIMKAFASATRAFEQACDVRFRYVPEEDSHADDFRTLIVNNKVKIRVIPENLGITVLADSRHPINDNNRNTCDIRINSSMWMNSFVRTVEGLTSETKRIWVIKHELGHALGLAHEHNDSSDPPKQSLTPQDTSSVMYYQSESGYTGDHNLSELDKQGLVQLYGPSRLTATTVPVAPDKKQPIDSGKGYTITFGVTHSPRDETTYYANLAVKSSWTWYAGSLLSCAVKVRDIRTNSISFFSAFGKNEKTGRSLGWETTFELALPHTYVIEGVRGIVEDGWNSYWENRASVKYENYADNERRYADMEEELRAFGYTFFSNL